MKKQLHIIYIPGLGDLRITEQTKAVRTWRRYGVEAEFFYINWTDDETWQSKLNRLLSRIDELNADGKSVALVGASAGAAAVITAFAERRNVIAGVVCIAGKINHPETVNPSRYVTNPAFEQAIKDCQRALRKLTESDRKRILSRFAIFDEVVRKADSRIPGAHNRIVPSIEHGLTIGTQITLGAPSFIRFLKRQAAIIK